MKNLSELKDLQFLVPIAVLAASKPDPGDLAKAFMASRKSLLENLDCWSQRMEEGDFEVGLRCLERAQKLAHLLQRGATQVPIKFSQTNDAHLGNDLVDSIEMQCRLRASELREELSQDDPCTLEQLSANNLSRKLRHLHGLVQRMLDPAQSMIMSSIGALQQMCCAFEEMMSLEINPNDRSDDLIQAVHVRAVSLCCSKIDEELESSRVWAADKRLQVMCQVCNGMCKPACSLLVSARIRRLLWRVP